MGIRENDFIVEFSRLQGNFAKDITFYEQCIMTKKRKKTKTGEFLKLYLSVLRKVVNDTSLQKAYNNGEDMLPAMYEYMAKLNWAAAMCFSCQVSNSIFCKDTKEINHLIYDYFKKGD